MGLSMQEIEDREDFAKKAFIWAKDNLKIDVRVKQTSPVDVEVRVKLLVKNEWDNPEVITEDADFILVGERDG